VCAVLKVSIFAAAIPAIPVASAHVILIVAITITSPFGCKTRARAFAIPLVFWILAEAFAGTSLFDADDIFSRAKVILRPSSLCVLMSSAAVAAIKITIFVIVFRITMRIGFLMKLADLSGF